MGCNESVNLQTRICLFYPLFRIFPSLYRRSIVEEILLFHGKEGEGGKEGERRGEGDHGFKDWSVGEIRIPSAEGHPKINDLANRLRLGKRKLPNFFSAGL